MRNSRFEEHRDQKAIKSFPAKPIGTSWALTGESTKQPFAFEAIREMYRSIFGVVSFGKVDRFRSEIQLVGRPVRGSKLYLAPK
ncbi:hypothetical protein TNCV_4154621 [Trichonephila clavipes]|nr:hypothetical protein TNCV_4154621 [Trichonephila clavipes]